MTSFNFSSTPSLHFGHGMFSQLPKVIAEFGSRAILVTGSRSFDNSVQCKQQLLHWKQTGVTVDRYIVDREPSPQMIDDAVKRFAEFSASVVIAIGGGSVLDAGKAISAMLPMREQVKNYLEGVGTKSHPGNKIPFIAVPTTAGTGSEATKNAVLSETGEHGYKRSLRHNNFIPNIAIVDPELMVSCPQHVTAASGMDAFTQLLESYLSTAANPMTDALAFEGLHLISRSLLAAYNDGGNIAARTDMALASYLSGITLANAGLGVVHGFASPIGGYFPIAHGVICSSLMAAANKITVRALRKAKSNDEAMLKYARVGKLFAHHEGKSEDYYIDFLLTLIENWTATMNIPKLSACGIQSTSYKKIIYDADNKNNPVKLTKEEMLEVLETAG